ncbi:GtrA family protein [Pararhizobium sp. YC-54]|uniref:GtrA family protein n=1 Tax=Pararhizobium sp. YC-54 TaxID=2986920 RepID=UPI0021F707FD|nr:GtrA family protein [Pararhizobium sp. YC-54]MCV9999568.1 GtrA family protein [Pararhizobium sp. YC-54]
MSHVLQSRFVRYFLLGSIAAGLQVAMLIALVEIAGLNKTLGSTVAFYGAVIVNYYLQRRFTFRSAAPHWVAMPKFVGVSTLGAFINILAFSLLLGIMHYVAAQCLSLLLVFLFNFSMSKALVFKTPRRDSAGQD